MRPSSSELRQFFAAVLSLTSLIFSLTLWPTVAHAQDVFSGSVTMASLNGAVNPASCGGVLPPIWCSGTEIGAWTNAAITQLPATPGGAHCGTIYIPAGSYVISTTIAMPRCVKLIGAGAINTNLLWSTLAGGGTYMFVVADSVASGADPEGGIEDISISGNNVSGAGGIFMGGDPGTNCGGTACSTGTCGMSNYFPCGDHENFSRVRISGFLGIGIAIGNNVWSMTILQSALFGNTAAISAVTGASNSGESMVVTSSSVNNNTSYAIYMPFAGYCPAWCWELTNDSFDYNGNGTTAPIQTGFISTNSYFIANSGPFFDATTSAGWVSDFGSTFTMASGAYFGKLTAANNTFVGTIFQDATANTDLFNGSTTYSLSGIELLNSAVSSKGSNRTYNACVTSQKSETGTADANVLTCSPVAAVGTYRISISISVSAASSGVIGWTATWTDSNGNAQAPAGLELFHDGAAAPALTFTTSAAGNYHAQVPIDVNNAGTNIVIKWIGGGTTAAKISAVVERIN
jgi:hypothetical protein